MQQDKKYYDNFYEKFGSDVHLDPVRFSEIAKLCKGRVLDIGCGTGNLSDFYKGEYLGVDISDVAIKIAKKLRRPDAFFDVQDMLLPGKISTVKFDTVVMTEFLEHINNDENVVQKLKEVINADTRLIIGVPNGNRVPDESHARTFTIPELRKRFSPAGRVKFYNWLGAKERILMTVDIGQPNESLLSLVIPAKNEGLGLENCILSCIEFVDQVVVSVDKNSTDNTLEIAKQYADILKEHNWENSFCKVRNSAQAGINTKWALQLDGHEYIEVTGNFREALQTRCDSFNIKIKLENNFSFYFPRLIRSYVKWDRDVHNFPIVKNSAVLKSLSIKHDREHAQSQMGKDLRDKQRTKMVFEIMTAALKKDKKDIRAYFYLAQQSHFNKDYKHALKYYKKYLKYGKNKQERWLVYNEIATIYLMTTKPLRAVLSALKAEKELPNRWETKYTLAMAFGMLGDAETSANYLVECLTPNKEIYLYNPYEQDVATIYDFIGASLFAAKKVNEAKIAWKYALDLELKKPEKEQSNKRINILKRMSA